MERRMTQWLHAEYRDYDGVPRSMVCAGIHGTFLFHSPLDRASGAYRNHYEVYRLPSLSESELCLSWFGLETRAIARLPDLPIDEFPFDRERRSFLPYDPIAWLLRGEPP
jgi:hypothetical protein